MAALKLTDGGHLAKQADGTITRYDKSGKAVETLKPGASGYGYWLELVCGKQPDSDQAAAD